MPVIPSGDNPVSSGCISLARAASRLTRETALSLAWSRLWGLRVVEISGLGGGGGSVWMGSPIDWRSNPNRRQADSMFCAWLRTARSALSQQGQGRQSRETNQSVLRESSRRSTPKGPSLAAAVVPRRRLGCRAWPTPAPPVPAATPASAVAVRLPRRWRRVVGTAARSWPTGWLREEASARARGVKHGWPHAKTGPLDYPPPQRMGRQFSQGVAWLTEWGFASSGRTWPPAWDGPPRSKNLKMAPFTRKGSVVSVSPI